MKSRARDPYVRKRHREGLIYASRAAYKLIQINHALRILRPGHRVVDLGCAPGGWSQVAVESVCSQEIVLESDEERITPDLVRKTKRLMRHDANLRSRRPGLVIGVDLLDLPKPILGMNFVKGDFTLYDTQTEIYRLLRHSEVDVVMSDMCPSTSGNKELDHIRIVDLQRKALEFSRQVLVPGGVFICKIFQGKHLEELEGMIDDEFVDVRRIKPPSSRKESGEIFIVARGYTPRYLLDIARDAQMTPEHILRLSDAERAALGIEGLSSSDALRALDAHKRRDQHPGSPSMSQYLDSSKTNVSYRSLASPDGVETDMKSSKLRKRQGLGSSDEEEVDADTDIRVAFNLQEDAKEFDDFDFNIDPELDLENCDEEEEEDDGEDTDETSTTGNVHHSHRIR